jgi:hypothetical protein
MTPLPRVLSSELREGVTDIGETFRRHVTNDQIANCLDFPVQIKILLDTSPTFTAKLLSQIRAF